MKRMILSVPMFIWKHPANRGRRLVTLLRSIVWQMYKRLTGNSITLSIHDGFQLTCYPDSASASLMIYCNGSPDYDEMHFMRRYLRAGDAFMDVGANVGVYTLLASTIVGSGGHVDSFEPGPLALQRLRENVALNALSQVIVHPVALSDENGAVDFVVDQDTTNRIASGNDGDGKIMRVPRIKLDDHFFQQSYAMGKMDVEGAEPFALKGAQNMLEQANPPVWLLELNGQLRAFDITEEQFVLWLEGVGYDIALYDADKGILEFSDKPWLKSPNVLAIARSCRQQVAQRCGAQLVEN